MNYESSGMYALTDETGTSRRRWLILGGVAAIIVVLILAFVLMRPAAGPAAGAASGSSDAHLPTVSVASPGRNAVDRMVSATGSLAARVDMPVGVAGEGGRVTAVLVQPGQWVAAGQVLATVDRSVQVQTASSLAASIAVAKSDAALAQSELNRAQALVGRGFISKADLEKLVATRDAANARVKVAQATLAETQARNARLDIRAPAAGLVLTRSVEPGQIISSGSGTLFRMAKGGEMELRAEVAESDIKGITVGARAEVTPVGGGQSFPGQVWQLPPVIDPQTRRGVVRIAIPYNAALRPGGFASASIYGGANTSPLLPNSAIQTDATGNFVYIVGKDDKVERRPIKTGEVTDRGVAIVEGLNGDERVVLAAGAFLAPGQKIKPVPGKL
ncbi:MAG: efflux RND transporter periplasmic adaptor subunit [Sphingomonas sp.]|uniref:efflux RND transporter periplasmic adaptor subunit n=1 Tax=Sphingomonas sp. TaxID=28214 RepID=UPI003F806A8C